MFPRLYLHLHMFYMYLLLCVYVICVCGGGADVKRTAVVCGGADVKRTAVGARKKGEGGRGKCKHIFVQMCVENRCIFLRQGFSV